jgi:hypothetical protein
MAAPTAREMAALEKARQNVKKETYSAILSQFSRKIKTSHELGKKEAFLTIPPFVIGFPRYDLGKALRYMIRQLQKLGYVVDMVGPLNLKVRWAVPKAEKEVPEEDEGNLRGLPSLVNLQKTAEKIRITKSK